MEDSKEILIKPCQSGKTFEFLQAIAKMLTNDNDSKEDPINLVHIIFCDNSLLQTDQLLKRFQENENLQKFKSLNGEIGIIFSSKSKEYKHIGNITHAITMENVKNVVTCSNKKRIKDIHKILQGFKDNKIVCQHKFCIWIDEIDKSIGLFQTYIDTWNKNSDIIRIGLITATPESVLKTYKKLNIFQFENAYDIDKYHSFNDSEFKICDYLETDNITYIKKVLEENKDYIINNQIWFVPGDNVKTSHFTVKDILIRYGFTVIVLLMVIVVIVFIFSQGMSPVPVYV